MSDYCIHCRRGQHIACIAIVTDFGQCTCDHTQAIMTPLSEIGASALSEEEVEAANSFKRKLKDDSAVTDQLSTGRKRAAKLYPLKDDNGKPYPCEFVNRTQVLPNYIEVNIDGCNIRNGTAAGIAQARHHLNYDTLDNSPENVVRICHSCHNLLHAKNDPFKDKIYERIYGFKPSKENLSNAAKVLRSGVVSGGTIKATNTPSK